MDQLNQLGDSLEKFFDFKQGDHWRLYEVETFENISTAPFQFERDVDYTAVHIWFQDNWTLSIKLAILYVILVFGGQRIMRDRERFTLQKPLILWNILLAAFSIFGTVRCWQVTLEMYSRHGIRGTICRSEYFTSPVTNFWSMVFILSKVPELFDTAFIVLRKQKLILLHWYHHITVMIYSWYTFRDRVSGAQWYVCMNFAVHAMMYSYYACRAMKIKIPKPISIFITSCQLSQMFIGVAAQWIIYNNRHDAYCPTHFYNILAASIMYGSYYVLFFKFFLDAYVFKKPVKLTTHIKTKTPEKGRDSDEKILGKKGAENQLRKRVVTRSKKD